jgi:hypothetical protein
VVCAALFVACRPPGAHSAALPETPEACRARRDDLGRVVSSLPVQSVALPTRVELPVSILGAVPGDGPLVEISPTEIAMNGQIANDAALRDRVARFRSWLGASSASSVLYVAVAGETDVQTLRAVVTAVPDTTELRLLVRSPPPVQGAAKEVSETARELTSRLLTERDPAARSRIEQEGFSELSHCDALTDAAARTTTGDPASRWQALKPAIVQALPSCDCGALDTAGLRLFVGAERRAGAGSLAWLPLEFIRDERCDAAMPLRSIKKLIAQIESFDAEFSGAITDDAMKFGDVVVNDRLRVYFCDALPGETLAAEERARATLFVKAENGCQPWTFVPLAPGSPFGDFRRAAATNTPPLIFHYRQAAEEIRIFGPVDPASPSFATDDREFPCDETFRITAVDAGSIGLEKGHWFYSEATCSKSTEPAFGGSGCVATRASSD